MSFSITQGVATPYDVIVPFFAHQFPYVHIESVSSSEKEQIVILCGSRTNEILLVLASEYEHTFKQFENKGYVFYQDFLLNAFFSRSREHKSDVVAEQLDKINRLPNQSIVISRTILWCLNVYLNHSSFERSQRYILKNHARVVLDQTTYANTIGSCLRVQNNLIASLSYSVEERVVDSDQEVSILSPVLSFPDRDMGPGPGEDFEYDDADDAKYKNYQLPWGKATPEEEAAFEINPSLDDEVAFAIAYEELTDRLFARLEEMARADVYHTEMVIDDAIRFRKKYKDELGLTLPQAKARYDLDLDEDAKNYIIKEFGEEHYVPRYKQISPEDQATLDRLMEDL